MTVNETLALITIFRIMEIVIGNMMNRRSK